MAASDAEKLAQYVRSLPDFVVYDDIGGNYDHIGATVADSVLQAYLGYWSWKYAISLNRVEVPCKGVILMLRILKS